MSHDVDGEPERSALDTGADIAKHAEYALKTPGREVRVYVRGMSPVLVSEVAEDIDITWLTTPTGTVYYVSTRELFAVQIDDAAGQAISGSYSV
jgi:hypothetical protein